MHHRDHSMVRASVPCPGTATTACIIGACCHASRTACYGHSCCDIGSRRV
jgi:hypothetical protein